MFAAIRDIVGGRAGDTRKPCAPPETAFAEAKPPRTLGANAVVGIDIDYEVWGKPTAC